MKLYMHPVSMTSRPVRLFMAEKGLKADEEVVDLMTGAHFQEPYASLNPSKLVPMLEDDGFKLTESSAILKYLADKFNLPEYPKDLKQRARVNEIMDWLNTNFYREWAYGMCYPQLFPHLKRPDEAVQKATVEWGPLIPYNITGRMNLHPRAAMQFRASKEKDDYVKFYDQVVADV